MENENGLECLGAEEEIGATVDEYNKAMSDYWKKNPSATDADISRFRSTWGPLTQGASGGFVASRGCGADGMTWEHWLFFVFVFVVIFAISQAVNYLRNRRQENTTPDDSQPKLDGGVV